MANRDGKRDSRGRAAGRSRRNWEEHTDTADDHGGWDEPRLMDFARKLVRGGAEVVVSTQDAIRERAADVKPKEIPREVVESVAHLTARTKDELISLLAREFKSYLEKMDLAGEVRSLAENYTLDVNMKVRLRPRTSSADGAADEPDDESAEDGADADPPAEADGAG